MNLFLGDTQDIISYAGDRGVLRNQLAYILATAYWETGRTMRPVTEYGSLKYLKGKQYYPYIGRGYVQLTWKNNYEDWSRRLGVDLVKTPDKAKDPNIARKILVEGMMLGTFTGKKLSDYVTLKKSDFVSARRIVNGTDKAQEIAKLAVEYDRALKDSGYGVPGTQAPKSPQGSPAVVPVPKNGILGILSAILAWLKKFSES